MNGDSEYHIRRSANEAGVAFTSSNPFVGYQYTSRPPISPSSSDRAIPSSILARSTAIGSSTSLVRTASSSSHTTSSTAVVPVADSASDTDMSSDSSHARRHAICDFTTLSLSDLAAKRLASRNQSPFTAPPVTLLVGGPGSPSKETQPVAFYVHEDVLTKMSLFFRAAFELNSRTGFSEGLSRTMKLPEDRPEDFAYLLQWNYWQLSNGPRSSQTQEEYPAIVSLQDSHTSALSLWHPSIDIALSHYQAYKAMKQADRVIAAAVQKYPEPTALISTVDANDWHFGLAPHPNTQQAQAQSAVSSQTPSISTTKDTHTSTDTTQPASQQKPMLLRPPPPVFGPLIRLYILVDKYALPASLKQDICTRVRDVGKKGKCVPDADDIAMLWEGVLEGSGADSEGEHNRTSLKDTVLEMYEALSTKSFKGLFFPSAAASTTFAGSELTETELGLQVPARDDSEEASQWHPVFMRDLLARKFEGRNAASTATTSGPGKAGDGTDGGWESFGELGRVRRRERFPSLYGVQNRSGEQLLGGTP